MKDKEYKVSEVAGLLDLTPETVRYYESVGLISPRHDAENHYRYYLSNDFSRLYNVKLLRSLNFGLQDIKSFFYEKDLPQQREAALQQADQIKEQLKLLERQIDVLKVMAEEIDDMERLENSFEVSTNQSFWLIPLREDYEFDVTEDNLEMVREVLEKYSIPRYSYYFISEMKPGLPCIKRLTGYSVRGTEKKPCDKAIYIPATKVIRFAYRLIAGERFSDAAKRLGLYERLQDMGVHKDTVKVFGHTINISTKDGVTYLGNIGYIPLYGLDI